ncbi:MAG: hypothetical protein ACR2LQ_03725 [Acidimicrobiales bacterium]
MATDPPADLELTALTGEPRSLAAWVTTFHLGLVVLDPFTYESAWLLEEAGRILDGFSAADVRVAWLVTAGPDEAKQFLGPWAEKLLTFTDPERVAVKAMGLDALPAFVHIDMAGKIASSAEGWDPPIWKAAVNELALALSWSAPAIPGPHAPGPFAGAPAFG